LASCRRRPPRWPRATTSASPTTTRPGKVVLSGAREALGAAERDARGDGLRAVALDVSGAFHSPQMRHAVGPFSEALQEVQIRDAAIPVLSCATAQPFREPVHELAQALVIPVRSRETMIALAGAGASTFVDVGAAATLASLTPYCVPGIAASRTTSSGALRTSQPPEPDRPRRERGSRGTLLAHASVPFAWMAAPAAQPTAPERRPAIVAVDDEPAVLAAVARDLRRGFGERFRILRATSGPEALDLLRQLRTRGDQVAMLIADQRMPGMPGTAYLVEARKIVPDAKRVLLTAYADTEAAIAAINDVALDYYLLKPWDPPHEQLFPVVEDLLTTWESGAALEAGGVRIVGHRFSKDSHELRDFLARNRVPARWLDVERDGEARELLRIAGVDAERLPVALLEDGSVLERPTVLELAQRLGVSSQPAQDHYDLVVVGGSHYLVEQIAALPNIEVRTASSAVAAEGEDGHLRRLRVREAGGEDELDVDACFVFIGASPRTDWLAGVVARDERGFILAGPDAQAAGWPLKRDP